MSFFDVTNLPLDVLAFWSGFTTGCGVAIILVICSGWPRDRA